MEACGGHVKNYKKFPLGGCQKNIYDLNDDNQKTCK